MSEIMQIVPAAMTDPDDLQIRRIALSLLLFGRTHLQYETGGGAE